MAVRRVSTKNGTFPDRPELSDAHRPKFTDEDIASVRNARKALGTDVDYIDATLPSASDLPDAATLAAIHQDLATATRIELNRKPDSPVMSSLTADALTRAEVLLESVEALLAVHETCREAPWLSDLYTTWWRHGLDAEPVRPLAAIAAALDAPIRRRTTIASYAVVMPDDAHMQVELVAAVERAAAGHKPFALVSFGKSEVRLAFASIRILDKRPDRLEEWRQVVEVLAWRRELATGLARWKALSVEFSLPTVPERLEDAARALQALLERINLVAEGVRQHIALVHTEIPSLFPYGLSVPEIISDIDHAHARLKQSDPRCRATG
jgi:hypothetical protein